MTIEITCEEEYELVVSPETGSNSTKLNSFKAIWMLVMITPLMTSTASNVMKTMKYL